MSGYDSCPKCGRKAEYGLTHNYFLYILVGTVEKSIVMNAGMVMGQFALNVVLNTIPITIRCIINNN